MTAVTAVVTLACDNGLEQSGRGVVATTPGRGPTPREVPSVAKATRPPQRTSLEWLTAQLESGRTIRPSEKRLPPFFRRSTAATAPVDELSADGITRLWARGGGPQLVNDKDLCLRRVFGLTLAQYVAILAAQGGVCAICRRKPKAGQMLAVDHDHDTGEIRGLLHSRCNVRLRQVMTRYVLNPPAREAGRFFVPPRLRES